MTDNQNSAILRNRFINFVIDKNDLKRSFEEYIQSADISLELRWQMFLDAPEEFSNCNDWIYDGLNFVKLEDISNKNWLRSQEYQRHSKIYLRDVVDDITFIYKNLVEGTEDKLYKAECYKKMSCFKDPDLVTKIKEQLLTDNIKSFIFDW